MASVAELFRIISFFFCTLLYNLWFLRSWKCIKGKFRYKIRFAASSYIDRVRKKIKSFFTLLFFFFFACAVQKKMAYIHIESTKENFCFFQHSLCLYFLYSRCVCLSLSSLCFLSCLLSLSLCVSIVSTTLPASPQQRVSNGHSGYSYHQHKHVKRETT